MDRYREGPHHRSYKAFDYYAFLAGHLITDDGLNTFHQWPEAPEDALPRWESPDREYAWKRRILVARGVSGDKNKMHPAS